MPELQTTDYPQLDEHRASFNGYSVDARNFIGQVLDHIRVNKVLLLPGSDDRVKVQFPSTNIDVDVFHVAYPNAMMPYQVHQEYSYELGHSVSSVEFCEQTPDVRERMVRHYANPY